MESVKLRAKTSFVNRWAGSVTNKQEFYVPSNIAEEFVTMGIAEYVVAEQPKKEIDPKKSSSSPTTDGVGEVKLSVSSPVVTPSPKTKSTTPRGKKTGK